MRVYEATEEDKQDLVRLMHDLWPNASLEELKAEVTVGIRSSSMHYFLAKDVDAVLGFCQLSFRIDYVPGSTSSPTAFLEGLYVIESAREQKVATRLVEAAARFAVKRGCTELASDTELDNLGSQGFHEQFGFEEVERVVHYIKKLSRYE